MRYQLLRPTIALAAWLIAAAAFGGTNLPVGPIAYSSNADYDANFKEPPQFSGASRSAAGYVEAINVPTAIAVFDTSATGGAGGAGGTGGGDANNDLANFTISADLASTAAGGVGGAFLLRLNNAEAAGYAVGVHSLSTTAVRFEVYENSSVVSAGTRIFVQDVPLAGVTLTANTFYPYKVAANGGTFQLDFAGGAAATAFTDATVSATVGQVGFVLDTLAPGVATRLDNFAIVPEPSCALLLLVGGPASLAARRSRRD